MNTPYKLIGWDIEIATELADDWRKAPSPGISVAAAATNPEDDTDKILWHAGREPRMTVEQARRMADWLIDEARAGSIIITWNGAGFDFPVLARECDDPNYERELAQVTMAHVDVAFQFFCTMGYMISLNAAAKALHLEGKLPGMSGRLAPLLWNAPARDLTDREMMEFRELGVEPGSHAARNLCARYVIQDALTTLQVYERLMEDRILVWRTRAGHLTKRPWIPLVTGNPPRLYTCAESLDITPPDTSWMNNPRNRSDFIGWAQTILGKRGKGNGRD